MRRLRVSACVCVRGCSPQRSSLLLGWVDPLGLPYGPSAPRSRGKLGVDMGLVCSQGHSPECGQHWMQVGELSGWDRVLRGGLWSCCGL